MKLVCRVDSSLSIGTGHVMRCLTLADELRDLGHETTFICRDLPGNQAALISGRGHVVERLPAPDEPHVPGPGEPAHAAWRGVTWERDAAETMRCLSGMDRPDWLILDHYGLDAHWEHELRRRVGRIMVIDDLADRPHECALLLDQNLYPDAAARYTGLLPADCTRLLGPRHALLRPEFQLARESAPLHSPGPVQRLLVLFGGIDPDNLTLQTLQAIQDLDHPDLRTDVVAGAANPHLAELREFCAAHTAFTLHVQTDRVAELMAGADLAIGAGGTVSWERCCLGLPTLVIAIAANQEAVAEGLDAAGAARYLGTSANVDRKRISEALRDLLDAPGEVAAMARKAGELVDGNGARRVARRMEQVVYHAGLRLRPLEANDVDILFDWANAPQVRRMAISTGQIERATHEQWFASRLGNPRTPILLAVDAADRPVGQVRFNLGEDGTASIDINVDPAHFGRGIGGWMLHNALAIVADERGITTFHAVVRPDNPASLAIFLGEGFIETGRESRAGVPLVRLELSRQGPR